MIKLLKIISPLIFLFMAGVVLNTVHVINGLEFIEALKDPTSILVSISLPLVIWGTMRLPLPANVFGYIILPILLIWVYFSYQYLSYSDYTPLNIPTDIAYGWHWIFTHKLIVLIVTAFIGLKYFVGRGASALTKVLPNDQD